MQYKKYNVSKRAKDRELIEEQRRLLDKLLLEVVWQRSYRLLETRFEETGTKLALGDGCFWKRQLRAPY